MRTPSAPGILTEPVLFHCLFIRHAAMCHYLAVVPIGWRCSLFQPAFGRLTWRSAPLPPLDQMRPALHGRILLSACAEAHWCALSLLGFDAAYACQIRLFKVSRAVTVFVHMPRTSSVFDLEKCRVALHGRCFSRLEADLPQHLSLQTEHPQIPGRLQEHPGYHRLLHCRWIGCSHRRLRPGNRQPGHPCSQSSSHPQSQT